MFVVLVVPLVLVAFLIGHRLGGEATSPSSPLAAPTATPVPSESPSIAPPLAAGTVSEALRQAYYAAGAGVTVCAVDGEPRCVAATGRDEPASSGEVPGFCIVEEPGCAGVVPDVPETWRRLPATVVAAGRAVLVADLSGGIALASLLRLDGYAERTRLPAPVNPDGQGILYFDLGSPRPGSYLVVISRLVPATSLGLGEDVPQASWWWRPYVVAVEVPGAETATPQPSAAASSPEPNPSAGAPTSWDQGSSTRPRATSAAVPVAAVTLGGGPFFTRASTEADIRRCRGLVVAPASVADGAFLPAGTCWDEGAVWWETSAAPSWAEDAAPQGPWIEVRLAGTYKLDGAIVQADNNDVYELSYRDPATGVWRTMWTVPSSEAGGGLQTRPDPASDAAREALPGILTDALRLQALSGDGMYSVSEVQVFGTATAPGARPGYRGRQ